MIKQAKFLSLAAVVAIVVSFMPWLSLSRGPTVDEDLFPFGEVTISATAWNTFVSPVGLDIPNWLIPVVVSGIAVLAWLEALSLWKLSRWVPLFMIGLAVTQLVCILGYAAYSSTLAAGIGAYLALLVSLAVVTILVPSLAPQEVWQRLLAGLEERARERKRPLGAGLRDHSASPPSEDDEA